MALGVACLRFESRCKANFRRETFVPYSKKFSRGPVLNPQNVENCLSVKIEPLRKFFHH